MKPAVEFRNVIKRYGDTIAVDDFSLTVEKGKFVTLLGSSGSGKTTSLTMLAGFASPDSGAIFIDGHDVTGLAPNQRNIGLVYQNYALFPHMTVAENVAFPLKMRNASKSTMTAKVSTALQKVRLDGFGGRYPSQLSGGQQQRVALARAMIFEPAILLMDEPLGALDKNLREEMQFEIKRIQLESEITTIYVTHDQEEAMSMSDHVVVMSKGRIEQAAPPSELYEHPQTAFVAQFIGSANVIPGALRIKDGRQSFISDAGAMIPVSSPHSGDHVRKAAVIRPERIKLGTEHEPGALPAVIDSVVYGGTMIRYVTRAGSQRIDVAAVNRGEACRAVGQTVYLTWSPSDFMLVEP
jgi:putative spermidine/putrescine transport system ATP-binding protein